MKSKDFEIRTPFLGVGDPLGFLAVAVFLGENSAVTPTNCKI